MASRRAARAVRFRIAESGRRSAGRAKNQRVRKKQKKLDSLRKIHYIWRQDKAYETEPLGELRTPYYIGLAGHFDIARNARRLRGF